MNGKFGEGVTDGEGSSNNSGEGGNNGEGMTSKFGGFRGEAYKVVTLALCSALMFGVQVALAALPNIELVSLLVIVFTLVFRYKVLYIIYVFVLLEGLMYGFNPWWWISYLYVWTMLAGAAWLFRSCKSPLIWGVIAGVFGLAFGALTAIPHWVMSGPGAALAYWVSGIPFDLIHCIANFALVSALWLPLMKLIGKLPVASVTQ